MRNKLRYLFVALCVFGWTVSAVAQSTVLDSRALRTNTWSLYAQGGASKAFGVEYTDVQPYWITELAPDLGAGLNYNFKPWLRFGLNYEFTTFSRQQQYRDFQPIPVPDELEGMVIINSYGGLAYSDLTYLFHNTHLSAEFNLLELWKDRQKRRFNLYLGTGIGFMLAQGRTYSVEMGSYEWADPTNKVGSVEVADNWATQSYVRANNVGSSYNALYVPATLSVEYDLIPQLTLGLKGEYKYMFNCDHQYKPNDGLATAALVLRWNLVGKKPDVSRWMDKFHRVRTENDGLVSMGRVAARQYDEDKAAIAQLAAQNRVLEDRNKSLEEALAECNGERGLTVFFDVNQAKISQADKERLAELARLVKKNHHKLTIVAEASSDGASHHNQKLSERRLNSVLEILKDNGLTEEFIEMAKAIGEESNVAGPEQRKAEVYLKNW